MPYKKRYNRKGKKVYKKKLRFRKRFKRHQGAMLKYVGPGRAPLPDKYFTKLSYQNWFNFASGGTTGVLDTIFRGNGAQDPENGLGGIGCNGFTELAGIYQQYRVYASKCEVNVKSISDVTSTGDFMMLLIPDRSPTSYGMSTVIARQGSPFATIKMVIRGGNGNTPTRLKAIRKTKNIFGESDIDDDNYAAATSTVPANEWYWHLVAARQDQSSISAYPGICFSIRITYYIRFERRQSLAAP